MSQKGKLREDYVWPSGEKVKHFGEKFSKRAVGGTGKVRKGRYVAPLQAPLEEVLHEEKKRFKREEKTVQNSGKEKSQDYEDNL